MKQRFVADHQDSDCASFDDVAEYFGDPQDAAVSWAENLYNHVLSDDASLHEEFARVVATREFEALNARVAREDGAVFDVDLVMVPTLDWSASPDQSVIVWRARLGKVTLTSFRCVFEVFPGNEEYATGLYVNHIPCDGDGCKHCVNSH